MSSSLLKPSSPAAKHVTYGSGLVDGSPVAASDIPVNAVVTASIKFADALQRVVTFICVCLPILAIWLVVAWYIVMPGIPDPYSTDSKYEFTAMTVSSFRTSMILTYYTLPLMLCWFGFFTRSYQKTSPSRHALLIPCAVSILLLVLANDLSTDEMQKGSFEPVFATEFNDFYCDARTIQACIGRSQEDLLALTHANDSPCRDIRSLKRETKKFLDSTRITHEVDVWCGNARFGSTSLSDNDQRVSSASFAANPEMFADYEHEWIRRMLYMNWCSRLFIVTALLSKFVKRDENPQTTDNTPV